MARAIGTVVTALLLVPGPALAGQLSTRLHVGAALSTPLVKDSILRPLIVEPNTALAAAIGVGWQVSPRFVAEGELAVTRAHVIAREGAAERTINAVTTVGLTAGMSVSLINRATARIGVGGIRYFAADATGVFARGGAASVMGTAALAYRWPPAPRVELGAEVRYDLHTFTTAELEARGFTGTRAVHRVGLGLSAVYHWPR